MIFHTLGVKVCMIRKKKYSQGKGKIVIRVPEFYPMNTLEQSWMAGRYFSEFFANDQFFKNNLSLNLSLGTPIIYYFIQNIVNMPFYYC